eukprot:UC4_evm2s1320
MDPSAKQLATVLLPALDETLQKHGKTSNAAAQAIESLKAAFELSEENQKGFTDDFIAQIVETIKKSS